jgi:hypothetical protein
MRESEADSVLNPETDTVENGPPVLAVLLIVAGPVQLFWPRYGKVRGRM